MAPPAGASAAYKKKDGYLAMSKDQKSISWTPAAGSAGVLTIQVANITNLQQTPANNPKVMLKIFSQPSSSNNKNNNSTTVSEVPEQYVFSFTSGTNARAEADAIKEALSASIQAVKASQAPAREGTLASMAGKTAWDDDNRLKSDAELQQSLLKSNTGLQKVFMESLRTKSDAVTSAQFMSQFWSTRVHLLRAHAIEKTQTRGSYNVLSTLKPRVEDNVAKLNISKEQIQLIFSQHPLVKLVYDENVPKLSEQQFWSRFFQSRLFKKLRGERVTDADATDSVLDKYLRVDGNATRSWKAHIPHTIDLEGNEENHSQRQGNRPDLDMRPTSLDKVPIIRTLNSLSEKIMANVTPVDSDPSAPTGTEEEAYDELQLRDLRGDQEQNQIILNIRDQSRFFDEAKEAESEEVRSTTRENPDEVLNMLRIDLDRTYPENNEGAARLSQLVEPNEGDSSDDEPDHRSKQVGSKASLASASTQIFDAVRQRRAQAESASSSETCGLSQSLFERLTLTHATTTEFLHQFWQAFLSGDPDRAAEIASLVESLSRAMDRIKAVADEAEAERQAEIEKLKQHAREVMASTGKTIRPNLKGIDGGQKTVNQLMDPTTKALVKAIAEYKRALAEEQGEQRPGM